MTEGSPKTRILVSVGEGMEFDFVIIGAGSAGCVVANRLSANPNYRVALLEAGGSDRSPWIHIPVGYFKTMGNPNTDWCYKTEADPGLNGRSIKWPRGKIWVEVAQSMGCFTFVVSRRILITGDSLEMWVGRGKTKAPFQKV